MILDKFTKAAFKMINTVAPFLNPESFLKGMYEDFDPNLSDEENAKRMMGGIQENKYGFGEKLAEAASYQTQTNETFVEALEQNPEVAAVITGDATGAAVKVNEGEAEEEEDEEVDEEVELTN